MLIVWSDSIMCRSDNVGIEAPSHSNEAFFFQQQESGSLYGSESVGRNSKIGSEDGRNKIIIPLEDHTRRW